MDQIKIGKFISLKRKEKNITQTELANMLNITDRSVSKWENGVCMPDASNIPLLCEILGISINDLFSGEVVDMKDNEKKLESHLLEMIRLQEETTKKMLRLEYFIGYSASITFLTLIFVASFVDMATWIRIGLILLGIITFMIAMFYGIKIEQIAGYYECARCHHKYVPTYKSVFLAMHMGRTRYMMCPNCGKRSWNKKIVSK